MKARAGPSGEVATPVSSVWRRGWRIAGIVLAVVVLLVAGALVALRRAYPPERLAVLLSEQVTASTGRAFRIDGDLSIHLLPTIAVKANDIVLGNVEWGSQPDMIRLRQAAFEVSLRELLDGRVRILSVDMDDADVLLESDGAGQFNWHLAPRQRTGGTRAEGIAVGRISVSNARITYRDGKKGVLDTVTVDTLDIRPQGERESLSATFTLGSRQWKSEGEIGHVGELQAGKGEWPFDLRFTTDGASVSAAGNMGTGPRAGRLEASLSARLDTAAALSEFSAAAANLPMPVEASATLLRSGDEWRAESMRLSLGGQTLTGQVSFHAGPSSRLDADLSAAAFDLARWHTGKGTTRPPAAASAHRAQFFGDTPLPFDALPQFPMQIALKVERFNMPGTPTLSALNLHWVSEAERLTIEPLSFAAAGGEVRGRLSVALPRNAPPRTDVLMNARSLSVETLDAQWGGGSHFKGGRANLDLKLAMTGRTPRSLAASSTGDVQLTMRDVSLTGKAAALDRDIVARLLEMLVPKQGGRPDLVVQCAVARLPLRNGVAVIDRSIAMETSQLAVTASGELNLAKQTIELAFRPRVKKGLDLNPGSLVQLMLVKGPLEKPELSIDPKGTVRQAANYGVAAATGGLSLLAPALLGGEGESRGCDSAAKAPGAGAKPQTSAASRSPKLPRPFSGLRQALP
ncbi:AsmA family protein [Variovorax sp. J2P1-59]|uniref:AsmA family protein n=1 Tax=Variovorax flavidus TaxID=3053501 RepID=UPI0025771CA0|nr:AsmA family protein [Variovorax sp. J2P1-59]MDM0074717.1 AsmA family protein [Variovorax sp. J2P1-59]